MTKDITVSHLETIETLWKEVLGLEDADVDLSFSDLGGTSLTANQFVARLKARTGIEMPVIRIFEYPTLRQFKQFLLVSSGAAATGSPPTTPHPAGNQASIAEPRLPADASRARPDIAIIGMACRFPGARNLEEYWQNLLAGKDTITELTADQLSPDVPAALSDDPRYVKAAGLLDEPYSMDASFFDINPMEAKLIDPQQRVLLELSWHALEHAGYPPGPLIRRTGVFAGVEDNSYYRAEIMPYPEAERRSGRFSVMTGNEKDYVAMRIAHKLDLRGPAVSVNTACSTSLVATIMAVKSLRAGECDLALAGGAAVHFPTPEGYYHQEGGVFSADGHCRPFDEAGEGTNFTDGAGMVVLKRHDDALRDNDTIFALIRGGAINNDGADKIAFSAPSISGQANCIAEAFADAGIDPGSVQYVEAHGTATPVGDPIEVEALRRAFGPNLGRTQYCGLGSVKSNIGHTTAAAGVASLIKTALALKRGIIPATLHFRRPNLQLDLERSPFYIVDRNIEWPATDEPRRAGVSSFGIGGTNSHLILESAPPTRDQRTGAERPFEILPVSARTPAQCDRLLASIGAERGPARDIAGTLQLGRARFKYRGARVRLPGLNVEDIRVQSAQPAIETPNAVFMFPGQGSQYIQMGMGLYAHVPEFRAHFDLCCRFLNAELGLDFKSFIFDAANHDTLENTRYTQPALFAIGVSLGRVLLDWGIRPALLIGHSIGEFAAAHLAGVFSLEDGVKLIVARGRLMASLPRGRMLSVRGSIDSILAAAAEAVDIASVNSPVHCVLAGDDAKIERIQSRLEVAGLPCRPLHTSHAFHSEMMAPVVEPFAEIVRGVALSPPRIPIISTVNASELTAADATSPDYWARHMRATVVFSQALRGCLAAGGNLFLEVGPRTTLSTLATQHFPKDAKPGLQPVAISMLSDQADPISEVGAFGGSLARLWTSGYELPWENIWGRGQRIPLRALYPFERKSFRYSEGRPTRHSPVSGEAPATEREDLAQQPKGDPLPSEGSDARFGTGRSSSENLVDELAVLFGEFSGLEMTQPDSPFVEAGFDSLLLMQIGVEISKNYGISVSLRELMSQLNTLRLLADHILTGEIASKARSADPARKTAARATRPLSSPQSVAPAAPARRLIRVRYPGPGAMQ